MNTVEYELRYTMARDGYERLYNTYSVFHDAVTMYHILRVTREYVTVRLVEVVRRTVKFDHTV